MNTVACCRNARILLTLLGGVALACAASLPARAQYTYLRSFGSTGTGNGQFIHPSDIKIDSNGNIFVLDSGEVNTSTNNRVEQFNSAEVYMNQFGTSGDGDGQFTNPLGLAIDSSNNIFVADTNNGRVEKFTNGGAYQSQVLVNGNDFPTPIGMAFDSNGILYISENASNTIQKYTVSGNTFTSAGQISGQFRAPYGIAIDRNNNIFVADPDVNFRVQEYSSSGAFIRNLTMPTGLNGRDFRPHDIAIDSSGNIFVTDYVNGFVARFSDTGQYLDRFGTKGSGDGQFQRAEGIAVDSTGHFLYVSDYITNRVEVFAFAAPVPEAGTLLTLAFMTAGGLCVTRRLKKDRRAENVAPTSGS